MTTFLRVLDSSDKGAALLAAIHDPAAAQGKRRFEVDPASFASVPRSPLAYWVSEAVRCKFRKLHSLQHHGREAVFGASTKNDFRFLRTSWEVPAVSEARDGASTCAGRRWVLLAKGRAHSPYYLDLHLLLDWYYDGAVLKAPQSTEAAADGVISGAQP